MIFFVLFFPVLFIGAFGSKKTLLSDIEGIRFYRSKTTAARRSSPISQLECIGGEAKKYYNPGVVTCYNQGWNGQTYTWRCDTGDSNFKFNHLDVSCEGYDDPDDPYILSGSCGLKYTVDFASKSSKKEVLRQHSQSGHFPIFVVGAGLFVMYFIYSACLKPSSDRTSTRQEHSSALGGNNNESRAETRQRRNRVYPNLNDPPPPYPESYVNPTAPPPPSYGFATKEGSQTQTTFEQPRTTEAPTNNEHSSSRVGGFWTGAGLGALAGYFAGTSFGSGRRREDRWHGSNSNRWNSGSWFGSAAAETEERREFSRPSTSQSWFGSNSQGSEEIFRSNSHNNNEGSEEIRRSNHSRFDNSAAGLSGYGGTSRR